MSRAKELVFRFANATLIASLGFLHRKFGIRTTYKLDAHGAAAQFEDCWFSYHPREFGCTGNIDFVPEAENATRNALFQQLRGGQVFYDIGAHGGVYSITLRHRFPDVVVHSFEPQPEDLLANLALNGMAANNVHPVAVGRGDRCTIAQQQRHQRRRDHDRGDHVPDLRFDHAADVARRDRRRRAAPMTPEAGPPSAGTRLTRPVSRSDTKADPSGRNARPHGLRRPLVVDIVAVGLENGYARTSPPDRKTG